MGIIKDAVDIILPCSCCICGRLADADGKIPYDVPEDLHICFDCLSGIIPQPSDRRFFMCLSEPYESDPYPDLPLYMPFPYKGFFEKAIPSMKFRHHPELARFAGILLGGLMKKDNIGADLIVPVPLSPSRLKERGYNQAGLIAYEASKICGIPYAQEVLSRVRNTQRQTEISDNASRYENVNGAFRVNDSFDIEGLTILVIDDVATTGNTLHEAACALYDGGASKVMCCAVCGNRAVLNAESY